MSDPIYTMSVEKAAKELKVDKKQVLALISSGQLPAAKVGADYIVRCRDVYAHIDKLISLQTNMKIRNNLEQAFRRLRRSAENKESRLLDRHQRPG